MGENIKGSVHYVSEKTVSGGKVLYSMKLDNDTYYGTGEVKPQAVVGDLVGFVAEKNDRGYWNVIDPANAIQVKVGGGTAPPPRTSGKGGGYKAGGGGGFKQDPATQASIIMQSAGKSAVELVGIAIAQEAIPLGTKKADRLQLIIDAYIKTTEQVFQQQIGLYVKVKGGVELKNLLATEVTEGVGNLPDPDFAENVPEEAPAEEGAFANDPDFN